MRTINQLSICLALVFTIVLLASATCLFAQRGTLTPVVTEAATTVSILAIPQAAVAPFKQTVLTWDNPSGASNRVAWGVARFQWTNSVTVATNRFNITNGLCYAITSIVNGIESVPALWPSNRFDRVIVQTSTNLLTWQDAFTWTTNFNRPQEYLRLRSELIRWE